MIDEKVLISARITTLKPASEDHFATGLKSVEGVWEYDCKGMMDFIEEEIESIKKGQNFTVTPVEYIDMELFRVKTGIIYSDYKKKYAKKKSNK